MVQNSFNDIIFKQGLFGYALHEIILDEGGNPVDYRFLEANQVFGKLTGLDVDNIIGLTVRKLLPGIENSKFNWIEYYGRIALNGGSESFEQFNEQLKRWYRVEVYSPAQNQFATIFIDITEQHILTDTAIEFNKYNWTNADFSKIADDFRNISGGILAVLNRFDANGRDYASVGISGLGWIIEKSAQVLGFSLTGKKWKYDPVREAKIKNRKTTIFSSLQELVGDVLPARLVSRIIKTFNVGEVAVVKTTEDERVIGDFTVIFRKGQSIKNLRLVETYADMVGLLLGRINAEEALRMSEKKFKAIASHTPDHIVFQDVNLRYLLVVNPVTGLTEQDMLGKSDFELKRQGNNNNFIASKKQVIKTGKPLHLEIPIREKNGKTGYYEGSFIPTINEDGVVDGIIGYFRNVSQRKIREEELRKAKIKAEKSEQFKSAFLANMSHEIRTPLNGIIGFTELLREPDLTPEEKERYLHVIETGGARLLAIINDIIDFSKIQSQEVEVSISETNVQEMLDFLYEFFKPDAAREGNELVIKNTLSDQEYWIQTDREKVYAVLTNLIKNALKFTKNGTIEVGCTRTGNELKFYVKDTGIGIPAEQKGLVFERFHQSSVTKQGAYEGTGLGLSISKAYVELLGGKIWVEDHKPGGGSIFYFTLSINNINAPQESV